MSSTKYIIKVKNDLNFGSNRYTALPLKNELEVLLSSNSSLVIDFRNVPSATQSWVDELIGKFVLKDGKAFLKKVQFKNCSDVIQELIKFVVSDRMSDHDLNRRRISSERYAGFSPV